MASLRGAHTKRKFKYGKELSPRGVEFGLLVASRLDLSYEILNVVCDGPDCRASRSTSEAIEGLVGSNHMVPVTFSIRSKEAIRRSRVTATVITLFSVCFLYSAASSTIRGGWQRSTD